MTPHDSGSYRSLLESLPYAFFAADAGGVLTDVNGAAEKLLGRARDELVGLRFDRVVAERDLDAAEELHTAIGQGETTRVERDFWIVRPDGTERLIHVALEVLRRDGEVVGSHGLFRDVTEEREIAARLGRSEERLRLLLERMPVSLWTVDRDMRVTSSHGALASEEALGRPLAEVLGRSESDEVALEAHRRALSGEAGGYPYWLNERQFDVRVEPLREGDDVVGAIGAALDVTESARRESELREQRAWARELFEASPEAIVLLDEDGRILEANPEFERLFGYGLAEVVGHRIPELIVLPPRRAESLALLDRVQGGERVEVEAVRMRKDGTRVNVSILAKPVTVGGRRRVIGIYRDVTDRKLLEDQLVHAQRMDALGQLAGGVAHDFNNILTAILGHARVLESGADDPGVLADLREIEASAERAAALVRHLLAFSRRERSQPRRVDLSVLVGGLEEFLRRTLGEAVLLETDLQPSLPEVEVDPAQMEQVLVNLLLNARDAMPAGGTVRVTTRTRSGRSGGSGGAAALAETSNGDAGGVGAHAEPGPGGALVVLEVSDEGKGMEDDVRARIFEPFFTTKDRAEAPGLGLSTVYGIVEQSGGTLEVETAPHQGTTVRVVLPAADAPESRAVASAGRKTDAAASRTVLLVDDDRPVREVTRRILERHGYEVVTAASGPEAVEIARTLEDPPGLLLLDVVMPGMDGTEVAEAIGGLWPDAKVLFMSGYTESELFVRSGIDEPVGLVSKPFDPATLVRRVREALASG